MQIACSIIHSARMLKWICRLKLRWNLENSAVDIYYMFAMENCFWYSGLRAPHTQIQRAGRTILVIFISIFSSGLLELNQGTYLLPKVNNICYINSSNWSASLGILLWNTACSLSKLQGVQCSLKMFVPTEGYKPLVPLLPRQLSKSSGHWQVEGQTFDCYRFLLNRESF